MPRTEARIQTSIWRDEEWRPMAPTAKLTYLSILSQPTLNLCGVIDFTPKNWASSIGISKGALTSSLVALAKARFTVVDEDTEELWVRTLIKNDGVLTKPYVIAAMTKDYLTIRSNCIRGSLLDSLGEGFLDGLPERFPKAFGAGIAKHIPEGFVKEFRGRFGK